MEELLRWDSTWSLDLIELMIPVALKIEAEMSERQYGAVAAAVTGIFDKKGPTAFLNGTASVKRAVERAQMIARGHDPDEISMARAADDLLKGLGTEEGQP